MNDDAAFRVDCHVKILNERVVSRAIARGLDALVYAPHFVRLTDVERQAERFSTDDLRVFPAREIFTGHWQTRKHVLALDLEEPIPDFVTLDGAMAELARQDAGVLVPHPEFLTVSLTAEDVRAYDDVIDAIEVYNPKHRSGHNRRATEIATETDYAAFASSYAHLPGTVGEVWTAFDRELGSGAELVDALRAGEGRPMHREGVKHDLRRALEFAHLGWENTYKKLDRVFLQGTEPTHPDHVAYDGAFDDVRVY